MNNLKNETRTYFEDKGKEIEKDAFFVLSREWDKEKILSPHEEFLMGTQNFFFVPLSWQDKKNIFL